MESTIEIEITDDIKLIRMTRGHKKNALTNAMYETLARAFEESNRNANIKVILLIGSQNCFCAGNDLNDFLNYAVNGGLGAGVLQFLKALANNETPLIMAVDGPAVGIGTTMLFHADLVYAAPKARFSTPFLELGLVPEAASSLLMPQRMGYARAFEMLILGREFSSEEAKAAGFVNQVVVRELLESIAMEAARKICSKPDYALHQARALMRPDKNEVLKTIETEIEIFKRCLHTDEAKAAFKAFLQKSA